MSKKQEYEAKQKQKEQDRRPLTLSERVQPKTMEFLGKLHNLINEYPDCIKDLVNKTEIVVSFYEVLEYAKKHPEIIEYVKEHPELTPKPDTQKNILPFLKLRKK